MTGRRAAIALLGVLAWLGPTPNTASAEWFADAYAGFAFSETRDVDVASPDIARAATQKDVKVDGAGVFGARGGYWFEFEPVLGLGLDVSHFSTHTGRQTGTRVVCLNLACTAGQFEDPGSSGNVTALGIDVLLRYPLFTSPEFPNGQLQPYFAAGPAWFFAHAEPDGFVPTHQTDNERSLGVKASAGVAWQFHRHFAAFAEYRFTHFTSEFHFTDVDLGRTIVSAASSRSQLLFGVSFRY